MEGKDIYSQFGSIASTYSNAVQLGMHSIIYNLADHDYSKVFLGSFTRCITEGCYQNIIIS